jgi:hypothetical protein
LLGRVSRKPALITALVGLSLAGASACGGAAPDGSTDPAAAAGDSKTVCAAVLKARTTASEAFAKVSAALAGDTLTADELAKVSQDLKVAFNVMHVDVATAAEKAGDPRLKAAIAAYQLSVEEAIVAVEGADLDKTELTAAIELPALRSAEKDVIAACA